MNILHLGFPGGSVVKNPPANIGIHGLERSPREGNGNPLQYSCLGNLMNRGAWQATVHGVAESWTGPERVHDWAHARKPFLANEQQQHSFPMILR